MKAFFTVLVILSLVFIGADDVVAQTYSLMRGTVFFSDGTIVDSLQSGVMISGTMWIQGDRATQEITVCAPGCVTASASATLVGFGENHHAVHIRDDFGMVYELSLLSLEPVMTFFHDQTFSEVDQWIPLQQGTALLNPGEAEDVNITMERVSGGELGGILERAIRGMR